MKDLPENIDFRVVHGFQNTSTTDVVLFNTDTFEKTGCEFEAEVFRITITNLEGRTRLEVKAKDHEQALVIGEGDVKDWPPSYFSLPPNCS